MTAAVFGLVGVIVGACVNGGVAFWARAQILRSERRVSARLVHAELDAIETTLSVSAEARILLEELPLPTPEWLAHKTALAAGLNRAEWVRVSGAYASITLVNSTVRGIKLGDELDEEPASSFDKTAEALRDALFALKPFVEGWNPKLDSTDSKRAHRRALRTSERRGM